jgi:DNA-binding transcriptional regulator YdaS (Cro superfamily)
MNVLGVYLKEHEIKQRVFAARLGVPAPLVSMWASGKRRPGRDNAIAIEVATKGDVPASAWARVKTVASKNT